VTTEHSQYLRTPKPRPIRPPKLHHATFTTMDVDAMVAFYELVAGLQPVYYAEHAAWLTNDEANHRIALLRLPGVHPPADKPNSVGLHHTAFEYDSFDGWIDNYERLRDAGIRPVVCLDHGMTMSMYYQDPDGNGVEIQVDVFDDWAVSKEWMWASQEFSWLESGGQLPMPVAAVGGELSLGERVAHDLKPAAPDLRPIVVDGAGHFVAEEQPGRFVEHLLPFLED